MLKPVKRGFDVFYPPFCQNSVPSASLRSTRSLEYVILMILTLLLKDFY